MVARVRRDRVTAAQCSGWSFGGRGLLPGYSMTSSTGMLPRVAFE